MEPELAELIWRQARTARIDQEREMAGGALPPPSPIPSSSGCPHSTVWEDEVEASIVCVLCGLVMVEKMVSKNEFLATTMSVTRKSIYRRSHHFNERIYQWTCRDPAVPRPILESVRAALAGEVVTKTRIRRALHQCNGVRFIERWIQIYCEVTGVPPPCPTSMEISAMKEMFVFYEQAFNANRPAGRKCIINYNFIFVRMLQTLRMESHYRFFPMLKSKAKVRALDAIWASMCRSMGVAYVPLPTVRSLR